MALHSRVSNLPRGALSIGEKQYRFAEMMFDISTRAVARFEVGQFVDTPRGVCKIVRLHHRDEGYNPRGEWVNGWRYVCEQVHVPEVKVHGLVLKPYLGVPQFTYREDELALWNPRGALVQISILKPPPPPKPMLVGNTMATPLLPAWSADVRCVCRNLMDAMWRGVIS